jgi:hypothetical protein
MELVTRRRNITSERSENLGISLEKIRLPAPGTFLPPFDPHDNFRCPPRASGAVM